MDSSKFQSSAIDTKEGKLILDSHKLSYHYERVESWENNEKLLQLVLIWL